MPRTDEELTCLGIREQLGMNGGRYVVEKKLSRISNGYKYG